MQLAVPRRLKLLILLLLLLSAMRDVYSFDLCEGRRNRASGFVDFDRIRRGQHQVLDTMDSHRGTTNRGMIAMTGGLRGVA